MTLTELRYIVALQETAHFGRAAEKCFVSQPTLSVAIKKLEAELGIALFERSRNQVRATPMGEQIIQQAQVVLEQTRVIEELATAGKDPLGSTLSVGAIHTVGPYLFPHFVPLLQNAAPNMPLYIEENFTANLRQKLRSGELDAIIIALPFQEVDVVTKPLYEERLEVLLPRDHVLAEQPEIQPAQLEQEKVLLLGEGHCFRDQVLDSCPGLREHLGGVDPLQSVVEGSSLETLKYMVASGLGVTVLPESATYLNQLTGSKLTTRPLATEARRTVALAWRASFTRPPAIDLLADVISQAKLSN